MNKKRIKGKKNNADKNILNKTDKELEKEALQEENISIAMIVLIILLCFVVGISLGYILYRIAINSSSVLIVNCII